MANMASPRAPLARVQRLGQGRMALRSSFVNLQGFTFKARISMEAIEAQLANFVFQTIQPF